MNNCQKGPQRFFDRVNREKPRSKTLATPHRKGCKKPRKLRATPQKQSLLLGGATGGRAPPPAFHTLAKDISLNGGATHFTLRLKPCISSSFLIINIPTTPSLNYPVAPRINGPICRNMAGNTSLIILNSTSQLLSSVFLSAFSKTATSTGFSILAFFYILKRCKST